MKIGLFKSLLWIFVNIHNNECFYTDTDSFTLVKLVVNKI